MRGAGQGQGGDRTAATGRAQGPGPDPARTGRRAAPGGGALDPVGHPLRDRDAAFVNQAAGFVLRADVRPRQPLFLQRPRLEGAGAARIRRGGAGVFQRPDHGSQVESEAQARGNCPRIQAGFRGVVCPEPECAAGQARGVDGAVPKKSSGSNSPPRKRARSGVRSWNSPSCWK